MPVAVQMPVQRLYHVQSCHSTILDLSVDQITEVFRKGEGDVKRKILETEVINDILAIKESREQNQFYSKKAFHCQIFSATGKICGD